MVSPDLSLESNTWYHIAGTYDGEYMKLYLNGELLQAETYSDYDTSDIQHSSVWTYFGKILS